MKEGNGPRRTFTGCWSCRSRGVKCDEKLPHCSQCQKQGKKCAGYRQNLVWVESSNHKKYRAGGRRLVQLETWENFHAPSPSELDSVIAKCDFDPENIDISYISSPPFSVFRSSDAILQDSLDSKISEGEHDAKAKGEIIRTRDFHLLPNPNFENRIQAQDAIIFYHYIRDVAPRLMPFTDPRNPWSLYPALALHYHNEGKRHLFHALMAHSAVALANKGFDRTEMLAASAKYYVLAMEDLRAAIGELSVDYVSSLTTIMTLIFTEMYHGRSKTWRPHLMGAWQFMLQNKDKRMWDLSDQAWYATQSFCLIKIMSDTSSLCPTSISIPTRLASKTEDSIMDCMFSSHLFGITLGASNSLMRCISDMNRLSQSHEAWITDLSRAEAAEAAADILRRLRICQVSDLLPAALTHGSGTDTNGHREEICHFHLRAFIAAAFIYFYQMFDDMPPCTPTVTTHVSEVLHNLLLFATSGGESFTFWPAFIAAVEVYTVEEKAIVRQVFTNAGASGVQNRAKVQAVVEEVWRVRDMRAVESGLETGMVRVDWRVVMRQMKLDVLLM